MREICLMLHLRPRGNLFIFLKKMREICITLHLDIELIYSHFSKNERNLHNVTSRSRVNLFIFLFFSLLCYYYHHHYYYYYHFVFFSCIPCQLYNNNDKCYIHCLLQCRLVLFLFHRAVHTSTRSCTTNIGSSVFMC